MSAENPWKQIDSLRSKWEREIASVRTSIEANRVRHLKCKFLGAKSDDGVITTWRARVPGPACEVQARSGEELLRKVRDLVRERRGFTDIEENTGRPA